MHEVLPRLYHQYFVEWFNAFTYTLCVNFANTGESMSLTDMGWSQDCPNTSEVTLMYMGEIAWDQGPTTHS